LLAEIGPEARAAIPALETLFFRGQPVAAAGEARAEIGYPADRILPGLIALLSDYDTEDTAVRGILALGSQAETAISALAGRLQQSNNAIQRKIAPLLASRGAETVVLLCWMLLEDREANLEANLRAILQLDASEAVPILVTILEELEYPDAFEIDEIFRALAKIGPGARGAVPALLRRSAIMQGQPKEGIDFRNLPGLLLLTLGSIGVDSSEVLSLLQKNLTDEESDDSRAAAAKALAFLGPSGAIAWRRLEEVAEGDSDLRARTWAACALAMIDRTRIPRLVSELIKMLKEEERREGEVHFFNSSPSDPLFGGLGPPGIAADVLCHLGPAAKAAVPCLRDELDAVLERGDGEPEVVELMIEALIRIGVDAKTLEPFTRELQAGEHGRRVKAIRVLHRFGRTAMPAMAALRDALRDPSPEIRFPAAMVLLDLDSKAPDAIRVRMP